MCTLELNCQHQNKSYSKSLLPKALYAEENLTQIKLKIYFCVNSTSWLSAQLHTPQWLIICSILCWRQIYCVFLNSFSFVSVSCFIYLFFAVADHFDLFVNVGCVSMQLWKWHAKALIVNSEMSKKNKTKQGVPSWNDR